MTLTVLQESPVQQAMPVLVIPIPKCTEMGPAVHRLGDTQLFRMVWDFISPAQEENPEFDSPSMRTPLTPHSSSR